MSTPESVSLTETEIGGWIGARMLDRSLSNTIEAARWRVLLAAFWDATRSEPYPEQERRPDQPQWDIVSLRSALENWGHHHVWCATIMVPHQSPECNCGFKDALKIGQYATLDPNGYAESADRSSPPSPETPRITMKHFDWCHSAAARFEDLARYQFSGSQWTHAREANLEAAKGMRELAQLIRPLALDSASPRSSLTAPHDADCPSRDGFYPENCECSKAFPVIRTCTDPHCSCVESHPPRIET